MLRSRTVRSTNGTTWTIRRRWSPRPQWRRLIRRRESRRSTQESSGWWDFLGSGFDPFNVDDFGSALLLLALLAAVVVFMIFLGIPLLIFLVETLLIIPVLIVAGVVGRVFFRRPWTIEAVRTDPPGGPLVSWNVVGWRVSSRAADRMATLIYGAGAPAPEPPADLVAPRPHRRLPR